MAMRALTHMHARAKHAYTSNHAMASSSDDVGKQSFAICASSGPGLCGPLEPRSLTNIHVSAPSKYAVRMPAYPPARID